MKRNSVICDIILISLHDGNRGNQTILKNVTGSSDNVPWKILLIYFHKNVSK